MKRAIAGLAAVAALALVLAGCSSGTKSGTETLSGTAALTSNAPVIPLTATGLVSTTGSINLGGGNGAGDATVPLKAGTLSVWHDKGMNQAPVINKTTCTVAQTQVGKFNVFRGTGSFAGYTGRGGTYRIVFHEKFAKVNGGCDPSSNAQPTSASVTFHATVVLHKAGSGSIY